MTEWSPSRRTVLRTGSALGAAALAGCLGDTGDGGAASPADAIPAGVSIVVHADVAALLADDRLRTRLDELFQRASGTYGFGVTSVEDVLDEVESSVALDPRDLQRATLFGGYSADDPSGVHLEAAWDESALRDAVGGDVEPQSSTYNDRTVYRYSDETALGVLEVGTYVVGTTAGVEGAIDVAAGDDEPVGGRVREAYTAAPTGALRFGFEPPDGMTADAGRSEGPVDFGAFASITHGYGGYAVGGDGSITLETDSADAAARIATELRNGRDAMLEGQFPAIARPTPSARVEEALAAIRIRTDDAAVRITASEGTLLPVALVTAVLGQVLGFGARQPVQPMTDFDFAWDGDAGALTITHAAGDSIPADELSVRGTGLDGTGGWRALGGSASGRTQGKPAVISGDSVTLLADPDYVARVIWEDGDGDTVSQLGTDRGPEAL